MYAHVHYHMILKVCLWVWSLVLVGMVSEWGQWMWSVGGGYTVYIVIKYPSS